MYCPYCGSDELDYIGIDDGGDYDMSLCDHYHCQGCGASFEADCIDATDLADRLGFSNHSE